ncbi:hypothetical protein B7Y94_02780 [Candidatus Saccharibacteria bacterium 32-49-12]|nr:MAG: hypothetical protein B7Y94_02780 [Candidatus Saccharibacteria bacterium 32-49-12]
MNLFQLFIAQLIALLSLVTATGVLIHDTNLDKALTSSVKKAAYGDMTDTNANMRAGSQPHTHVEHLAVKDRADAHKALPRKRDRKRAAVTKRVAQGYHGNGVCMPLAGEWV